MKCPHCGGDLEMAVCPECRGETPQDSDYCCRCGVNWAERELPPDLANRVLCPDGTCTGILNEQGVCGVCGRSFPAALEDEEQHG
jgi:hypothetical protein